ncbi:glycosyltransferase family 4 protein [Alicyclobacillus mengziensis]|nr:glycosyltransferase family 4 protein [Alicyclobacillus mengziensis]
MGGSPFSETWKRQVLREYELADYILVSSVLQQRSFIEGGQPPSKILRAPLGIDTNHFSPLPGQSISFRPREQGEKFRIIQVGQVSLLKGFQYVLEALKLLNDPEIEILLLGGIGWRGVRRMVESYQRSGVRVLRHSGDPVPWFRSSHICVHASIQDGFGLAPLEAMSCGLPLIVTNTTGLQETVRDGVNGYVIRSRDVNQIAERIQFLKENDDIRINMARKARATALEYDVTIAKRNYAQILHNVWNPERSERSGQSNV